ncbi:hypothetical protein [Nioella aestuarii]|uniref:hypothetical protein n=1 Tax=Nioella aestuarii TaxID=1662864 RepID=UPI003D7FF838
MFKSLPKSLAAVGLAVTVALTGTFASTTEARADRDDLRTFLGAAAGIVILGNILNDRHSHTHHYAPAPVTRYVHPPATHYVAPQVLVPSLIAPSSCHRRFEGPSVDLRAFGARCMQQHVPHYAALPNSCRESIFTYQGWRDVYDAQCLYRHGWVRS